MARDLGNGVKLPLTTDSGSEIFDALEGNILAQAEHDHSPNKGELLHRNTIEAPGGSENRTLNAEGLYEQELIIPDNRLSLDIAFTKVYLKDTMEESYAKIEQGSSSGSIKLITNDSRQDYVVLML